MIWLVTTTYRCGEWILFPLLYGGCYIETYRSILEVTSEIKKSLPLSSIWSGYVKKCRERYFNCFDSKILYTSRLMLKFNFSKGRAHPPWLLHQTRRNKRRSPSISNQSSPRDLFPHTVNVLKQTTPNPRRRLRCRRHNSPSSPYARLSRHRHNNQHATSWTRQTSFTKRIALRDRRYRWINPNWHSRRPGNVHRTRRGEDGRLLLLVCHRGIRRRLDQWSTVPFPQ